MKPITDHELLKLAEKWDITRPNFIGHKTAFAQGFRQAEQLLIQRVSQQRELLEGFVDWFNINDKTQAILSERIEEYIKTL